MDFGPVSDGGSLLPDQRWLNAYIMAQTVGFCNPVEHTISNLRINSERKTNSRED
jgi:hypothetical protein